MDSNFLVVATCRAAIQGVEEQGAGTQHESSKGSDFDELLSDH